MIRPTQTPAQLSLPLQRERRQRAQVPPFVCEDPDTGQRWFGRGRMPKWVKAYKREHFMYPVAKSVSRAEFDVLALRVAALEMRGMMQEAKAA
jgi:hypothetical protein